MGFNGVIVGFPATQLYNETPGQVFDNISGSLVTLFGHRRSDRLFGVTWIPNTT